MDRKQFVLDAMALLRAQGGYSSDGVSYRYRGPGGRKCVLGFFIPDEVYTEGMEHHGVSWVFAPRKKPHDVIAEKYNGGKSLCGGDLTFLRKCQSELHDIQGESSTFLTDEEALRLVGVENG